MVAAPSLEDFRPPYHFRALGCALLGVWDGAPELSSKALGGFDAVRWRGGHLGVALVLRHDRPPIEYPEPYSEMIFAYVVRRGARWAAVPFELVLDNEFHVTAGRHHYHLPKRLDPTLRIDVQRDAAGTPRRMTASAREVAFEAVLGPPSLRRTTGLLAAIFGKVTDHVSVIGTAAQPPIRALIPVHPDPTTASSARVIGLTASGRTLRPLHAQFWTTLDISVGIPSAV